jgi:hypothetical protein
MNACRSNPFIVDLAEVHTAMAGESVGMKAAMRESEPAVVSATEMGVSATEMPSPEMAAAKMMAAAVTPTMSAPVTPTMSAAVAVAAPTSAKCHARQDGHEHDDGNSDAWSRHSTLTALAARHRD